MCGNCSFLSRLAVNNVKVLKPLILFGIGGTVYIVVETIWRNITDSHPTHWTMFVLGGLSFLVVGGINEYLSWETPFWLQSIIGTACVLVLEFISGCILNIWLGSDIWDYSNIPLNILGQVCLPFAIAWVFLVSLAIVLDDWLRYWLFGEEKPTYVWKIE